VLLAVAGLSLGACNSATDKLLQAVDPDIINPSDVNNPDGADALRIGALSRLTSITASSAEGAWFWGGLLTDEWKSGDTFTQRDETDKRSTTFENTLIRDAYRNLHRSRIAANLAIAALKQYKPSPAWGIGQMYFVRGYAEMQSAENWCNGQPFSDGSTGEIIEGKPVTVAEAFQRAIASADEGLTAVGGASDVTSVKIINSLKLVKARSLMGLGGAANYAAAVTVLAGIPTIFTYDVTFAQVSGDNGIWSLNNSAKRYVVGDSLDANGIIKNSAPFVSAKDPRVPTSGTGKAFDSTTPFAQQLIWASAGSVLGREDPVSVVNGIDARLIEAEVQLSQGNTVGWLATLNALRAGPTQLSQGVKITGMAPLVDPGTAASRLALQFREKGFWTFGRGERLGDFRRLIRQYNMTQDQVFPTGVFPKGGVYGTDVNLQVPQAETNNSLFTACTDRNA
jgi:hypothetical protein